MRSVAAGDDGESGLMAASWIVLPRTYWSSRTSRPAGRASPSRAYSAATCSGERGTPVAGSEIANGPSTRSMPSMAADLGRVLGDGRDRGDVRRRPLDVGEDDDRRGLARGELGLERDVGIAALDAGRVDVGAGDALDHVAVRDAGDEQDGQGRDHDLDRVTHDPQGDVLPARRPGRVRPVRDRPEPLRDPAQRRAR